MEYTALVEYMLSGLFSDLTWVLMDLFRWRRLNVQAICFHFQNEDVLAQETVKGITEEVRLRNTSLLIAINTIYLAWSGFSLLTNTKCFSKMLTMIRQSIIIKSNDNMQQGLSHYKMCPPCSVNKQWIHLITNNYFFFTDRHRSRSPRRRRSPSPRRRSR